ncbi:MAG: DEAD/DEAH box helicase [Bacilli bacterium]|nr:DEAD/DEAH box helicase [Bacilli bacterium]
MKFKELQLSDKILVAIENMGYEQTTPIQEAAIPKILNKKDIIGLAQTGTGKTAAFALPMIDILLKEYQPDRKIKALILTPTRELAIQIRDNILEYAKGTNFKCSVILGGVNQNSQKEVLKKGIDILVATPGRLVDLMNQKKVDLNNVKMLVLDEADTMLDMGFIKDIKTIINKTPKTRQTLLFSATMPNEIKELSVKFMNNPLMIKTKTEEVTADKIEQELYYVDKPNKIHLLLDLIDTKEKPTTLIFTRTKHGANDLEDKLAEFKIKVSVIHGNKTQSNRVKALKDFKSGKTRIMVATDIAARGIDINDLGLVINYDIPEKPEIYVHRIGRTARAGKEGKAISLCSSAEVKDLKAIEKLIKKQISIIEHKYTMVLEEVKPSTRGKNKSNKSLSNNNFSKNNKKNTNSKNTNKKTFRDSDKRKLGTQSTNNKDYRKAYSSNNNKSNNRKTYHNKNK